MAQRTLPAKKGAGASKKGGTDEPTKSESIKFIGDIIQTAVTDLERKEAGLPEDARAAIASAIRQLEKTSAFIQQKYCRGSWYMFPK